MKHMARTLAVFLLALALVIGLVPGMGLTAYAAGTTYTIQIKVPSQNNKMYTLSTNATLPYTVSGANILVMAGFDPSIQSVQHISGKKIYDWNDSHTFTMEIVDTSEYKINTNLYSPHFVFIVTQNVLATEVSLDTASASLSVGDTVSLTATVKPDDATDKRVKWSVGGTNADAVKLYSDAACNNLIGTNATSTLTVYAKAISGGSATITATSNSDDTLSASCNVRVHAHDFTYVVGTGKRANTITATCNAEDRAESCSLKDNNFKATLTIKAPATDGGAAVLEANPEGALGDLSGSVKYQTKSGGAWSAETGTAPTAAGFHRASITLGEKTASVTYGNNCITYATGLTNGTISGSVSATVGATVSPTITPADGYQLDTLTVTPEAGSGVSAEDITVNGGKFVMPEANVTVSATFKEIIYTVEVDGAKATVTDNMTPQHTYTAELTGMPEDKTYDGETVKLPVKVKKSKGFPDKVSVGTVRITDQNNNAVTTATGVGTYTASATIGDKTISEAYVIHGREPSITYTVTEKLGNNYLITKTITDEYIPLENNPNGITLLKDGRTYAARGNLEIGALVFKGAVNLVLCENTTVTIRAGIYHIGSELNVYTEVGAEKSALIIKGSKAVSSLDNYADFASQNMKDTSASLSGTVRVYGGQLTVEKGKHKKAFASDISLTLGAGMNVDGLTGGKENDDGSVTYGSASLSGLTSLAAEYKLPATVVTAPVANTLTYSGQAQALVTAGEAKDGEMQYALGTATEATGEYSATIPTGTNAGNYYVWYKAVGDADHRDTEPASVTAVISPADKAALNAAIDSAAQYGESIKDYTEIAATLKTAIDAARAVAANDNVVPDAIADAVSKLNAAVETAKSSVVAAINQAAAQAVTDAIKALPEPATLADKAAVAATRAAYDALTDAQKALVPADVLKKLTDAEAALAAAEKAATDAAADAAAAQAVSGQINALPESATLADKAAVAAARAAYDALTDAQKALVPADTLKKLTDAEAAIAAAEAKPEKIDIAKCTITAKDRIYTGKTVKAKVTVMYGETKLKEDRDYTLSYNKAKSYQKVWVTVRGKGQFEGKKKVSFKIIPKGTTLTKATGGNRKIAMKWRKRAKISGYQIEYSLKKDFSGGKRIYYRGAKTLAKTVKNLKAGKTYYVRIRTYIKQNNRLFFSAWSEAKAVKTKGAAKNDAQVIEIALNAGDELDLATVAPGVDAWESGDEAVATVSEDGVVKTIAAGQAEVTGQNADGDQVTVVITVSAGETLELGDLKPIELDDLFTDEVYEEASPDEEIELTIE